MGCEPLVEVGLLGGAEVDAGVDAVEGFGEGSLGGFHGMGVEEGGCFVAESLRAEGACGGHDAVAGVGGELCLNLAPVIANVVPGLMLGFALLKEIGEDNPTVLVADLAGDGVVKGAC